MSLIEKIKAERTFKKNIGGITYTIEIPRMDYIARSMADDKSSFEVLKTQIKNWEGVTESHFIEGGDPKVDVPFDVELLEEYLGDRPLVVDEIFSELLTRTIERNDKLKSMGKP